ncbi:hypothetical protein CC78DRAFT_537549 [Lojkania enalia]|uniref:F-box domain-containing protein n=1 Tax=Lojkania enalia TaxID=147567 RepID=A0A9P4MXZ0_9PLEO|nr:hypothetical protein CC78DRAFT_537549 [Didymosphaeria enalia]
MLKRKLSNPTDYGSPSKLHEASPPLEHGFDASRTDTSCGGMSNCSFLDRLPTELRLTIYEHLVVSRTPLLGATARKGASTGLSLSIFQANRQIYCEAHSVFLSQNTFHITSNPSSTLANSSSDQEPVLDVPAFEPPLPRIHWPSIHHLTIDIVYYPSPPPSTPHTSDTWKPACPAASTYLTSILSLLSSATTSLRTFTLIASISESFCARQSLLTFFLLDRDRAFIRTLAALPLAHLALRFEFPDCFYRVSVCPNVFEKKSILLLACQVIFCQSQVRIDRLLEAFESGGRVRESGVDVRERMDLAPYVGRGWPRGVGEM